MRHHKAYFLNGLIAFAMALFYSCDTSEKDTFLTDAFAGEPVGIAYNIRMVYTDSLRIKAILTAPVNKDYTNLSLQYSEFPEGLKLTFIGEQSQENVITADYGKLYQQTSLIDLRGNVVLNASDGSQLKTPQLYWDAEQDWIFTEENFNFTNTEYNVFAKRLDTNKEFTKFKTGKLTGTVAVEEE